MPPLQEEGEVPVKMLAFGKRPLTVTEHGTAITFTHKLELLFKFNPPAWLKKALSKHLAETMDNEAAALGFLSSDVKIVATPTSLTGLTFGTAGLGSCHGGRSHDQRSRQEDQWLHVGHHPCPLLHPAQ